MAQTSKTIVESRFLAMRTTEAGDKYLVITITYDDNTQQNVVLPIETTVPV
jgi:hypothetical protein